MGLREERKNGRLDEGERQRNRACLVVKLWVFRHGASATASVGPVFPPPPRGDLFSRSGTLRLARQSQGSGQQTKRKSKK